MLNKYAICIYLVGETFIEPKQLKTHLMLLLHFLNDIAEIGDWYKVILIHITVFNRCQLFWFMHGFRINR